MQSSNFEQRHSLTPDNVLALLKKGNDRFLNNLGKDPNKLCLANESTEDRFPLTTILSCSDMRMTPALIFDQSLGDIFSLRVAGNIANADVLGSMEHACASLGSKLVVVLGHTQCGAVKFACDDISFGNMNRLTERIRLSIARENETLADVRNSKNRRFLKNVARLNVQRNMEYILESSSIIRELIENKEINLVGAMYSIETGSVDFLEKDGRKMMASLIHSNNRQSTY
jgi:carbonic anhydrase